MLKGLWWSQIFMILINFDYVVTIITGWVPTFNRLQLYVKKQECMQFARIDTLYCQRILRRVTKPTWRSLIPTLNSTNDWCWKILPVLHCSSSGGLWWIQSGFHYQMQHVELWFLIAITAEGLLFEDLWFNVVMYDLEQSNILISLYIFLLRCLFSTLSALSISEFFLEHRHLEKNRTRDN